MKTFSLFAILLLWTPLAQAERPCNQDSGHVSDDLSKVLEDKASPCQELNDAVSRLEKQVEDARVLRDGYAAADKYWLARLKYYNSGQSALIDGVFGKSDLASASLMSVELVLDALVVGKAVSAGTKGYKAYGAGSKYVRGIAKTNMRRKLLNDAAWGGAGFAFSSGVKVVTDQTGRESSLAQRMMEAELAHFQRAADQEVFKNADAILNEVENPSFHLVDLIPFVSPVKRLNKMFGADDMMSEIGDALMEAKKERYRVRRLKMEQEQNLQDLLVELGRKKQAQEDCAKRSNS